MIDNKEHIRFFYSSFSVLASFKEGIVKDKENTALETKRKLLEIDFCLGKSLVALQKIHIIMCLLYAKATIVGKN